MYRSGNVAEWLAVLEECVSFIVDCEVSFLICWIDCLNQYCEKQEHVPHITGHPHADRLTIASYWMSPYVSSKCLRLPFWIGVYSRRSIGDSVVFCLSKYCLYLDGSLCRVLSITTFPSTLWKGKGERQFINTLFLQPCYSPACSMIYSSHFCTRYWYLLTNIDTYTRIGVVGNYRGGEWFF